MVQWLKFLTFSAKGMGSFPGRETKISQAARCGQKQTKTQATQLNLYFLNNKYFIVYTWDIRTLQNFCHLSAVQNWASCILSGNPTKSKCSTDIYGNKGMTEERRKEARQGRRGQFIP